MSNYSTEYSGPFRPPYAALWFLILTTLAGVAAYYWIFSGFGYWDDEGSLLLSVRQFLGGTKLYSGHLPDYGPVYYFYEWFLHSVLGIPLTHDTARITTLISWLLTALLCAWIVLRLTRSVLLSFIAHLLSFWRLAFLRNSPGHPQELCILFAVAIVASGIWATAPRSRFLGMACLGVFPAALLLVKINIGVYMILAVALVILSSVPRSIFSRGLFFVLAISAVILPSLLMKAHLHEPVAERYCLAVVASTIAMLVFLNAPRAPNLSLRDFWIAVASFTFTAAFVLFILVFGMRISPRSILDSLVIDNLRISVTAGKWYMPVRLNRIYVPWILAGLASAVFFVRCSPESKARSLLLYLKALFLPLAVVSPLLGQSLLGSVTPFCWLVLVGPQDDARLLHEPFRMPVQNDRQVQFFPRALLCSVTVLQTLYAYPIAGAQYGFIEVLPIVVANVCWGNFFLLQPMRRLVNLLSARQVIVAALLFCVPLAYAVIAGIQRRNYFSLASLDLPGAAKIRLPVEQARDYHWLVKNLEANCDIFFGMPELPSLHIWTDSYSAAGMNVNDCMIIYDDQDQAAIAAGLTAHPKACAFYNPRIIDFWNPSHENMDGLPLARYIHENFKVVGNLDNFSFLVRKDRVIPEISSF